MLKAKNTKKSFMLVLLTFILSLSGCTGSNNTSTSSESKGSETTTSEDTSTSESSGSSESTSEDTSTSESSGSIESPSEDTSTSESTSDSSTSSEQDPTIHVESISINPSSLELTVGDYTSISVSVYPANATDLSYTLVSNAPSVANVDPSTGIVTAEAVGNATITAISNDGSKEATCSVSVTAASADTKDIEGVYFNSASFEYDSFEHSIEVEGIVLDEYTITYTCTNDSSIENKASEIGTYNINATISGEGYHTLVLSATLMIYANDEVRYIKYFNDKVYFENALDNDYLYTYDSNGVTKVSNDQARYFAEDNTNIYYTAKSLFSGSIKKVETNGDVSAVADVKGDYLAVNEGYAYYAVNALLDKNSGIYKISLNEENASPELLSTGKAYYLTYYNNNLYFADGSNSNKLSSISLNESNPTRTLVGDGPKINNLIEDGGVLYFTINNWAGNYIAKYTISTQQTVKLTSDAGENLVVIDNTLYYENVDKLNTLIYGDGIYSVSTNQTSDNNSSGKPVIGSGTICSLAAYSTTGLIYYDLNNGYDLCIYDLTTNVVTTHILNGFVPSDDSGVVLNFGGDIEEYNGKIYFLNMYDNKTLYAYSPASGAKVKITSNKVNDFSIIDDWLYFNEVTWLVNNNLYRVNLKEGGEPELVNTNDCVDMCSDGTYLYYVKQNWLGSATSWSRTEIHKANLDGSEDETISSKGPEYMKLYEGYLYYSNNNKLYKMDLNDETHAEVQVSSNSVDAFDIADGYIYYRRVGTINRWLSKMDINGTSSTDMLSSSTDPTEILVSNGTIYYTNDVTVYPNRDSGIYSVSTTGSDGDQNQILARNSTYYPTCLCYYDGYIYFLNSDSTLLNIGSNGDAHFYRISATASSGDPEQIA